MVSQVPSPTLCGGLMAAPSEATNEKAHREWLRHSPGTTDLSRYFYWVEKTQMEQEAKAKCNPSSLTYMPCVPWGSRASGGGSRHTPSVGLSLIRWYQSWNPRLTEQCMKQPLVGKGQWAMERRDRKGGPVGVCSNGSHFTPLMMLCATASKPEWTPKQALCLYAQVPQR